ncbi:MAG: insulinase family protein [Candidatus Delongbacteria bacterium]|nr:insulinase family protein [Candidatus Delongbacteria bacterium]
MNCNKMYLTITILFVLGLNVFAAGTDYITKTAEDNSGYTYEYVTNDPTGLRIYTLENGLKVYLSDNKDKPKILAFVAVRAGSKNDPAETTGLAHYFEHLMFKGTDEIGTINWEKEEPLIQEISDLYEMHRNTSDPSLKKKIYFKIDSVSTLASKYAVPSEYTKMMAYIGADGTNAWTSVEETVYTNEIPSNELERWLKVESERFSRPVFRLFHTELETVYEEFNMSQDNDGERALDSLLSGLYKKHQYGTQTTLGEGEHLKNPSMVNIMNFFDKYYVPNNMAICLAGDIDHENTIELIDKYWGGFERKPDPVYESPVEKPLKEAVVKEVFGPDAESVMIGFRLGGENTDDAKYLDMINSILYNGQAGLIDIDLVQKQKVLSAYSWNWTKNDYSEHILAGNPREGQTLDEVKDLLLAQLEKIKKGDFDEVMLKAAVNIRKLYRIHRFESNWRAYSFVNSFITKKDWEEELRYNDELEKITKQEIIDFANANYKDNYVTVYKREGKDSTVMKVEKPEITPIVINRDTVSQFFDTVSKMPPSAIDPVFVKYKELISEKKVNDGVDLKYIKNNTNELFSLYYLVEAGTSHDPRYLNAGEYLDLLGTEKFSPEEFKRQLYINGLNIYFWSNENRTYIMISGLDKSFEKGLELMYDMISNAKPDRETYNEYVNGVLKQREDNKKDKNTIFWSALYDYAKYGENSPFKNVVPSDELKKMDPEELVNLVKEFLSFKHSIMYYGPRTIDEAAKVIKKKMPKIKKYRDIPDRVIPAELPTDKPKVYFVNYDMVQMNLVMLSKLGKLNIDNIPIVTLFNEYFDGGMSRLVFQEIREAQGLAYAAGAGYRMPDMKEKSDYIFTYIMTQPDKFNEALRSMNMLLNDMPRYDKNFNDSVENIRKSIQTERIIKSEIFWSWIRNRDRGIDFDIRETVYDKIGSFTLDELYRFYEENIKGRNYFYLIMADKEKVDLEALKELGEVEEVSLEQIFGY